MWGSGGTNEGGFCSEKGREEWGRLLVGVSKAGFCLPKED